MLLPVLPPAFHLVALDRELGAFDRAVRAAPRGIDDGTVYWTDRTDRLELAVVLEPEAATAPTLQSLYVLMVATGDALGTLLPPGKPVAYAWPSDVLLDGARLGRVRAAIAPMADPAAVPPWLVLGLELALAPLGTDPGRLVDRTSLFEEGAGDITVTALLEAVTRHLLHWTGRWLDEGLAPVRATWNRHCFRRQEMAAVELGGKRHEGAVEGLDERGRFLIGSSVLALDDVLPALA
jgi:BirA family biotin operon repressor/biotin-[acetyl-CoA-carboxylase] ligase